MQIPTTNSFRIIRRVASLLLVGVVVIAVVGCNKNSENAPTAPVAQNSGATSAPSQSPAAVVTEKEQNAPQRKPAAGKGNAIGRVLYNGKGAANIEVQLCEKIGFIGGCTGKSFSAKTNKDGFYIVDNVTPGGYSLAVRIFTSNKFIYPTSGILSAATFNVEKDKSLDIRTVNLWKVDLQTTSPKNGARVNVAQPKFTWKSYPDASNYKVTVRAKSGIADSMDMETGETSIAAAKPLLNGDYTWTVQATNAQGVKIAETASPSNFKVTGQAGSNVVELVNPKKGSTVSGANVTLQWKAHPQASEYKVYLKGVKAKDPLLSFESMPGTSYQVPQTLPPDQYFWSVNAHKDGDKIAGSELESFTVK